MDAIRWGQIKEVYDRALDLCGEEREGFLAEACAADHALHTEVDFARALNVEGVIEGSVKRVGQRVRITAHLIEAKATVNSGRRAINETCATPWLCMTKSRGLSPRRSRSSWPRKKGCVSPGIRPGPLCPTIQRAGQANGAIRPKCRYEICFVILLPSVS